MRHAAHQHRSLIAAPTRAFDARVRAGRDTLEDEADRAAEQALAQPEQASSVAIRRRLQPAAFVASDVDPLPPSVTRTIGQSGMPLEHGLRADMERRFGYDFSRVRVHADHAAAESAQAVHADAYTAGHHIVFGAGAFAPHSRGGLRLIAHELAHVVQQSSRSTARVLQRKPAAASAMIEPAVDSPADVPAAANISSNVAAVLPSANDRVPASSATVAPAPAERIRPQMPVAPPLATSAAPQQRAPLRLIHGGAGSGATAAPAREIDAPPDVGTPAMPQLSELIGEPRAAADTGTLETAPRGVRPHEANQDPIAPAEEVDLVDLLATLSSGARIARQTIHRHSAAARAGIDRSARRLENTLDDQRKAADDAVRKATGRRLDELKRTIRAHQADIDWFEARATEDANTYATNAKAAQTDGFAFYRGALANVFDRWSRIFDRVNTKEADYLQRVTDYNVTRMWRKYANYRRQFIDDIPNQSEARRDVQRDAAYQVVEGYVEGFEETKAGIVPEIANACERVKAELARNRDQALTEYDKGLPLVLKGIDDQRAAALPDIATKAAEARHMLANGADTMRARIKALEQMALDRNAAFHGKVHGQIESGRAAAVRQFARAEPEALAPIAGIIDEAVGMVTAADEVLDPQRAEQFVDEVAGFSLAAADATGEVFAAAREAAVRVLAGTTRFARRGFAAGKNDLDTTLHSEGAENELALINFGTQAEAYVRSPLKDLDLTFEAGVEEAATKLQTLVNDAAARVREPMETARDDIRRSVALAVSRQNDTYWQLGPDMHNAAQQAAWRYDNPHLKYVVDVVEVALGFLLVVGILIGIASIAVALFGELVVAVIVGFMLGYFGAKAYTERREKKESRLSALLGAFADVTGFTEARRAFTDSKMKPFDRGMAWGGFWLGLFGAAEGASRFVSAVKVRLPGRFTNPFRAKPSMLPATMPEVPVVPGASEAPIIPKSRIGYELPHQRFEGPDVPAPATPKAGRIGFERPGQQPAPHDVPGSPPAARGRIGYELPHQKLAPPDLPPPGETPAPGSTPAPPQTTDPAAPLQPKRVGFELPHEQRPVREGAPPSPRRGMGFVRSEQPAAVTEPATAAPDRPTSAGQAPDVGGVIPDMPRAREVSGSPPVESRGVHASRERPSTTLGPTTEAPRTTPDEASGGASTPGAVVSRVDPPAAPPETKLSPTAEALLADEQAIQAARDARIADEARVAKLTREVEELEEMIEQLGRKRPRDYIDDAYAKARRDLQEAKNDLHRSQRAEGSAEGAERIHLRRRPRDVDPSAALHDPAVKLQAEEELAHRRARIAQNDALIKANEPDLIDARERMAARQKEFDATAVGKDTPQGRLARDQARTRLKSAERHLESVEARTESLHRANQKHVERMQDLDRVLHPEEYPELSGDKGDYGEQQGHAYMDGEGYDFRGSSKAPTHGKSRPQGLDGVYEKRPGVATGPQHVVVEAKYDAAKLRPGQEKWEWVDDRLDDAVGRDQANRMREEGYEYWVLKYDPKTGRVLPPKRLWEFRPNGKYGPGRRPLGNVHLIPPS